MSYQLKHKPIAEVISRTEFKGLIKDLRKKSTLGVLKRCKKVVSLT